MTAMTERADRTGRVSEWLVVGAFSCVLMVLVAQALSAFVLDGMWVVALAFVTSPLVILVAVVALITSLVLLLIKRFS
jgi:hypothetical protein